jgi:hypothetical protein
MPGLVIFCDMGKIIRLWAFRCLFPFFSAIFIASLIFALNRLVILEIIPYGLWLIAFFPIVVALEVLSQRLLRKISRPRIAFINERPGITTLAAAIFWAVVFYGLIFYDAERCIHGLHTHGRYFQVNLPYYVFGLLKARPLDTAFLLAVWFASYYIISVRFGLFRLATVVFIPCLLLKFLVFTQTYYGGIFNTPLSTILHQDSIKLVLSKDEFIKRTSNKKDFKSHLLDHSFFVHDWSEFKIRPFYCARDIFPDSSEKSFVVTFGQSFIRPTKPTVWPLIASKDLETNAFHYRLWFGNLQGSTSIGHSIIVAPWESAKIFELSTADLSTIKEIDFGIINPVAGQLIAWEPISIVKDVSEEFLYITSENTPVLLKYDLTTKKLLNIINFWKLGLVENGGLSYALAQSPTSRMVYVTTSPGDNDIIEVDPDSATVKRILNLNDFCGSALVIDDQGKYLYFQSGYIDNLYKIDLGTFSVVKILHGALSAKRLILDKAHNSIYVLDYFSGEVFPIDIDSGKKYWTLKVGPHPHGMAMTDNYLWINSIAGAFRIDLKKIWNEK